MKKVIEFKHGMSYEWLTNVTERLMKDKLTKTDKYRIVKIFHDLTFNKEIKP